MEGRISRQQVTLQHYDPLVIFDGLKISSSVSENTAIYCAVCRIILLRQVS
ncbi:hypothetical protein PAHAL_8G243700 [Panicum hallii]|uniref:Uncharacterized protein n=1 Tax=Panicum hallii TaxID=206008 RepID=A0A2T8IA41_9POAL|nr:hypothetical protein PAHAL_8G243700 [Panicum hallii]